VVRPLVRSLEQFQLGDGGGPACLIAYDAERFRSISDGVRTLVDWPPDYFFPSFLGSFSSFLSCSLNESRNLVTSALSLATTAAGHWIEGGRRVLRRSLQTLPCTGFRGSVAGGWTAWPYAGPTVGPDC
jgi:hypothetical protein